MFYLCFVLLRRFVLAFYSHHVKHYVVVCTCSVLVQSKHVLRCATSVGLMVEGDVGREWHV